MAPATRSQTLREAAATSTDLPQHNLADPQQLNDTIRERTTSSQTSRAKSSTESIRMLRIRYPDTPPKFIIDLSLPPEQRYLEVCAVFEEEVKGLVPLFDEVVSGFLYGVPLKWVHFVSRTLMRKVYEKDENRELKGISQAAGVPMYLLVCFNVLLDLFMGCSSGGAAVKSGDGSKMLHFRTLDWGMPSLRKVVVQLDFQKEKGGPIVASSLTYAGYVGVLTGVKKELSMSLNFRPYRVEKGQLWPDTRYYWHLFMVLIGQRRSISSELRQFLLPRKKKHRWRSNLREEWESWTYEDTVRTMSCMDKKQKPKRTTACYLCFSNGTETTVIEKDYRTSVSRSSREIIVVTNTDQNRPDSTDSQNSTAPLNGAGNHQNSTTTTQEVSTEKPNSPGHPPDQTGMAALLKEATERQQCAEDNYQRIRMKKGGWWSSTAEEAAFQPLVTEEEIVELVQKYPTTNEETHFACVMDPKKGCVKWCRRWVKPVSGQWIARHMSETL
ncbi:hypothetical protein CB0940_09091 [Cercospora beticola]|uniref:ceramidase n=1 Tax=Cercospora beticola TaxID=122368 RepID=A0A2G5HHA3_CERBT|nr:hypothetical protein CB0940_09091 [Cercospora beticola]PIA91976.1 hypothetical protein CB0940_09091 [Cercospora beticola]WPB06627.1 hypothetical protein RHO25_011284 [Cercospora beticola]